MQATVFSYDEATMTGSVITDQGLVLPFGERALRASGLRHLRPGQRLTVTASSAPVQIVALHLGSIVPT